MSKPAERERAKELRRQGWTVPDIAIELGVSKSSVSQWVRCTNVPESRLNAAGNLKRRAPAVYRCSKLDGARAEAERLYEEGNSRESIAKLIRVSKPTVCKWLKGRPRVPSKGGHERPDIAARNKARGDRIREAALREADEQWPAVQSDWRNIYALGLYSGEGAKGQEASFCNCSMDLLLAYKSFLDRLSVDQGEMAVRIILPYSPTPEQLAAAEAYWRDGLGLPESNFRKTGWYTDKPMRVGRRSRPYGTCHLRVSRRHLHYKIMRWCELCNDEFRARDCPIGKGS